MGEDKEGPHGKSRYGERLQRDLLGGVNLPTPAIRKPLMDGSGFFDSKPVSADSPAQPELSVRTPLFKKGTVLYAAKYRNDRPVLPFNKVQAEDLAKEVLEFEQNLEISDRSIGEGKNRQRVIKPVGKSSYGAFVEILVHRKDRSGKDVVEKRFVRLQDRELPKNNPKRRFLQGSR